jgi:glycosyltransferase involved in cell wall biosynthesis
MANEKATLTKAGGSPYVSIIIPTLNEEKNIAKAISGVRAVMKGYRYELIIVDGSSIDRTVQIAKSMHAKVILIKERGKGVALIKGFRRARGEIIISMDADLSNRPKELKLLIAGIETGYDLCVGSRFLMGGGSEDIPWLRRMGNSFFVHLVNIIYRSKYSDMCYGYRSFSRRALKRLQLAEKSFGIETEINIKAKKAGLKILEVPSLEKKRSKGQGKLHTFRDGYGILKTIIKNIGR